MSSKMPDLMLERLEHCISNGDPLSVELAIWLGVYTGDYQMARPAGELWVSREVAIAGVQTASGRPTTRSFAAGLAWLRSCQFFVPHATGFFETDPLAILCVAIGVHHLRDVDGATWLATLAERATQDESDAWRIGLLSAAMAILGKAPPRPILPELFVAFSSKGVLGRFDQETATKAMEAIFAFDEPPAARAAIRLASYRALSIASLSTQSTSAAPHADQKLEISSMGNKVKILFVAANPQNMMRLALADEQRDIQNRIREGSRRDAFEIVTSVAARPDDLELALLEHKPVIVHFSGHGLGALGIAFQGDDTHDAKLMSADAFRHLFKILKKNVRIVVLNACYSEEQAKAIVDEIDFVVGMNDSVGDIAARKFAASFYRGLGFGESVGTTFELGINALKREGLVKDENVPVLLVRNGVSADAVLLGPRS